MTKFCVTCKAEGHTYLECPRVDFFSLLEAAFGFEPVPIGGQSRESLVRELAAIEAETLENVDV